MSFKKDFPWFKEHDLVYLDSAATTLKSNEVLAAANDYLTNWSYNPHNKDSMYTYKCSEVIEDTRKLLSQYIGTKHNENIVFTPGATFSLNMIADGIKNILEKDDEIIINVMEHASNILPWYKIAEEKKAKVIFSDITNHHLNEDDLLKKINSKTKIVSFANATNLLGTFVNAEALSKKIRAKNPNIIIVIDATQYVALHKMDVDNSDIDFVVCSGHKMTAPTGIGMIYFSPRVSKLFKPYILGGGMNNTILKDSYTPLNNVEKYEAGTPNVLGIFGWNAALKYLLKIDLEKERQRLINLKKYLDSELVKINDIVLFNQDVDTYITVFKHKKVFGQDFANYLGQKKIIVRSGLSCAKLIVNDIAETDVIRASMYLYTDKEDVDKLIEAVKKFKIGDELDGIL